MFTDTPNHYGSLDAPQKYLALNAVKLLIVDGWVDLVRVKAPL